MTVGPHGASCIATKRRSRLTAGPGQKLNSNDSDPPARAAAMAMTAPTRQPLILRTIICHQEYPWIHACRCCGLLRVVASGRGAAHARGRNHGRDSQASAHVPTSAGRGSHLEYEGSGARHDHPANEMAEIPSVRFFTRYGRVAAGELCQGNAKGCDAWLTHSAARRTLLGRLVSRRFELRDSVYVETMSTRSQPAYR